MSDGQRALFVGYCKECGDDRLHFRATNRCQTCAGNVRVKDGEVLWLFDGSEWTVSDFGDTEAIEVVP